MSYCQLIKVCYLSFIYVFTKNDFCETISLRGHSKITSSQKYRNLEHPDVTISHTYYPLPHVTRQTVTTFFLDQRPGKIILHILYN